MTKATAPDYNDFVTAGEEMHLDKIEKKVKSGKYSSGQDMTADFDKIVQNAAVYNAAGNGKYGGPGRASLPWQPSLFDTALLGSTNHIKKPKLRSCGGSSDLFLPRLEIVTKWNIHTFSLSLSKAGIIVAGPVSWHLVFGLSLGKQSSEMLCPPDMQCLVLHRNGGLRSTASSGVFSFV